MPPFEKLSNEVLNAKILEARTRDVHLLEKQRARTEKRKASIDAELARLNGMHTRVQKDILIEKPMTDVQILGYAVLAYLLSEIDASTGQSLRNLAINEKRINSKAYRYCFADVTVLFQMHETFLEHLSPDKAKAALEVLALDEFRSVLPENLLELSPSLMYECSNIHQYVKGVRIVPSARQSPLNSVMERLTTAYDSIRLVVDGAGNYLHFEVTVTADIPPVDLMELVNNAVSESESDPGEDDEEELEEDDEEEEEEEDEEDERPRRPMQKKSHKDAKR